MAALVFTYVYFSYACRTILFASFKTMASYDNNLRNMRKTEEQRLLNDLKHKRSNLKSIPTLPSGSDVQRKLYTFLRQIIRWTQNHGLQDLFAEIQGSRPRQFARGEAALYRAKVENVWLRTNHLKEMCYNARDGIASCYEMYKFLILAQSATEESRAAFFTEDADGVVLEPKFSSEYIRMEMEFLDELLSNMQNEMNQAQIQMNNEDHSSELCEVKQMMVDLQKTVEDTMCTIREEIRSQNERIVELINTAKITNETREEIRTILKDLKDDVTQVKTEIERKYDIEQRQRTPSEGEISEDVLDFDFEELPSSKTASDTKQNTHESDPKPVQEEVMNTHTNFREDTSFLEWRRRDVLSQMESLEHAIKMSHRTPRRCFAYLLTTVHSAADAFAPIIQEAGAFATLARGKEERKELWANMSLVRFEMRHFRVKMDTPDSKDILKNYAKRLAALAEEDIGIDVAPMQPRVELGRDSVARMYKEGQRKRAQRRRTQPAERISVRQDDIRICALCFETDPVLPAPRH
ncbi:hypothetical protein Q1695_006337 [Nippostrongylus brasiliensis]|nr:hypothetical protein Q1695_006337 [Nippostrongylus brasiliensis]